MKHILLFAAAAGIGATSSVLAQSPGAPALRIETSFDITVHATYAQTTTLFSPEGERVWAGHHWNPQFLYPQPPRDEQGAVFTIQHGPMTAIWINTLRDLDSRHFQYAYFIPDLMVTLIDVRFQVIDESTTQAHITYTRTAVSPEADPHVRTLSEADKTAGIEWQKAIDAYLASNSHPAAPAQQ